MVPGQGRPPGVCVWGGGGGTHPGDVVNDPVQLDDEAGLAFLEAEGGVSVAGARL